MELRSHTITMYLGALVLVAACSSSNVNSNPFEQATQNPHFDAGLPPAPAASASSAPATGGNDMKGAAGSCSSDSDCGNLCNGAQPCCCDTSSSTCFSPESGTCPTSGGGGNDATTGGGDDGSSSGDDSGGSMQMMP